MRFSIIIPIYNASSTIVRCLDSIYNQTFKNFEVIALNDGSSDDSLSVLSLYQSGHKDMNLRIISHENMGAGRTRNKGIELSEGEFIVFVDSDDYVDIKYLESINCIITSQDSDVIFVDVVRETYTKTILATEYMSTFVNLDKDEIIKWQLTGKIPWGGVRKVYRREILLVNNIRYAPIKVGEESVFSFLALFHANNISFQNSALYHYVENDSSLTANDTIENPIAVYSFVRENVCSKKDYSKYFSAVNALGVTTVVIIINLLAKKESFFNAVARSRYYMKQYKNEISGDVYVPSLDKRVRLCYYWLKIGIVTPIIIASYLQSSYKTLIQWIRK